VIKALKIIGVIFFVLVIAAGVTAYIGYTKAMRFLDSKALIAGSEIVLEVPRGSSFMAISELLAKNHVVPRARYFYYYMRYLSQRRMMGEAKSGEYLFKSGMTPRDVALKLFKGDVVKYKVTVPEGLRYEEIADILTSAKLVDRDQFIKLCRDQAFVRSIGIDPDAETLEGYLFPDTYTLPHGLTAEHVIRAMVKQFRDAWAEVDVAITIHQAVTLASIVEKETGDPTERPLISAVFSNRLRLKMKLQTDPTVIYGILRTKGAFNGNLTRKDLENPTPFNTYTIDGLPPGPICNPGAASLRAVAFPVESKALYFVSKNDGTHTFCPNYKCHLKAVTEWQVEYFKKKRAEGR
jgi:UPF0755 protein